jgi:hypothetical protein
MRFIQKDLTRGDVKVLGSGIHFIFRRSEVSISLGFVFIGCRTCGARYGLISKGYSARDLFYVGIKSSNVFKQPGVDPNGYSGHSFRKPSCPVESLLSLPVAMTRLCGQLG